jgi:arylsulfatase A-like enzyme/tetratricopeptide (TPR) repeat protein
MRPIALCLVAIVWACGRSQHPDVLLVTLDTTRADRLGAMGRAEARTPVFDGLGARGVLYERAFASAPLTLPSHATILTGLDPDQHGLHDNGRFVLSASIATVAERLTVAGYDTAAFVAAFVLDESFGLGRGFARYDDDITSTDDPLRFDVPRRAGHEVTDRALAWLATPRRTPRFLWVHYYDVHLPREPPPPYDALSDPYDGALAYVDAELGRLLEAFTHAAGGRPTLVIVVGDHGESLGEHGEESHGILAYDATLHVPLVAVGPGFPAGHRSAAFVRTVDVAPTIVAAVGAPPLPGSNGRPLAEHLSGTDADDAVGVFESLGPSYRMGWARLSGVRDGRWKYTAEPEPTELYDTVSDPGETINRVADEPAAVERLAAAWQRKATAPDGTRAGIGATPPDAEERLAALGYVDVPQRFPADAVPDPRKFVGAIGLVDAARMLAGEGQVADGVRMLEALAATPVARPLALTSLAPLYLLMDRSADAVRAAEGLVALAPGPASRIMLARALLAEGRTEEALRTLDDVAADGGAPSVLARLVRARILLQAGRPNEVATVLGEDPRDDESLALASRARAAQTGARSEIPQLEAILRSPPAGKRLVETRAVLASLLEEEGRDADAVRVLETDPHPPPEYRARLADIAARHGNPERAATLYESVVAERPAMALYRRALIDVYAILGRSEDALAHYDQLIAANPDDAALHVDRGAVEAKLSRTADAENDYRRAIALDANLPEAYLNLALIELGDGRDGDAEAHLERALALQPDYQKAHFHLARLYARRHDPRAREHAERAVGAAGSPPRGQ